QKLPKGFQRAEFLLEHGFVDRIIEREEMKDVLGQILKMHSEKGFADTDVKAAHKMNAGFAKTEKSLSAWDRVQISRKKNRPVGTDYIEALFDDFIEFHGDRYFKDDHAIVGGIAHFHGMPVTVI